MERFSKTYITVIALLFSVQISLAQVQLLVKGGANYTTIDQVSPSVFAEPTHEYCFGYHLGLVSYFYFGKKFSFRPELLFSNKGTKYSPTIYASELAETRIQLNYLSLPLLVGYNFTNKVTLSIGVELGYLLSVRAKVGSENNNLSSFYSNRFDVAPVIGMNYAISAKVGVGLRYVHGLVSLAEDLYLPHEYYNIMITTNSNYQNRAFQLFVMYRLK